MTDDQELTEDEAMAGGIVWVCERGHVDAAHKTEGNHLNLCSRCKDGVCEPRRTFGRRSKEQRQQDRELGIYKPRRRRSRPQRAEGSTVTIAKRGQDPVEVDAESLRHSDPTPPFTLSKAEREALLAGKPPRISFPRQAPAEHPEGKPYPAEVGDVVPVTANVFIIVLGFRVLVDERVLQYEVRDQRPPSGGTPFATSKEPDKPSERMGGPEFRPEREPQPLPRAEVRKMADRVRQAELEKQRRTRDELGRHLKEQASAPRDVRFHLAKTIESIERRIGNIEAEMAAAD